MAKADAWGATEGNFHARHDAAQRASRTISGRARMIPVPAYRRLLAAEPFLKRLIPVLIITFLIVVAGTRCLSLLAQRDDIERSARGLLALAATQLAQTVLLSQADGDRA